MKEKDNNNWQTFVIHTVCNPKHLEFSANVCIYSKLCPRIAGKTWAHETQWEGSRFALGLFPLRRKGAGTGLWTIRKYTEKAA